MKILIFFILLAATSAQAETYRWTEKEEMVNNPEASREVPNVYRNRLSTPDISSNKIMSLNMIASSAESRQSADGYGIDTPKVEDLKEQMLKDEKVMALIRALRDDPETQALLSDAAILHAIQDMDIGTLINNPDFMKLFNNHLVREIEKHIQSNESK